MRLVHTYIPWDTSIPGKCYVCGESSTDSFDARSVHLPESVRTVFDARLQKCFLTRSTTPAPYVFLRPAHDTCRLNAKSFSNECALERPSYSLQIYIAERARSDCDMKTSIDYFSRGFQSEKGVYVVFLDKVVRAKRASGSVSGTLLVARSKQPGIRRRQRQAGICLAELLVLLQAWIFLVALDGTPIGKEGSE